MYFKGDIIITDPMYVVKSEEDWHRCAYGENLEALGIVHYITSGNGDCFDSDVFSLDAHEWLGEFGSDSGMVTVMLLSELRRYHAGFDQTLEQYCYTIVEEFDGEVELCQEADDLMEQSLYFMGKGNKRFRTGCFAEELPEPR